MKLHWLRSHFHVVALLGALALASVSWLAARHYLTVRAQQVETRLAERYARTRVLVAGTDLVPGTLLSPATLAARDMPVRYVPSSTARVDDLARVEGQRLLTPLKAGDPVPWSALAGGGDIAFSTQLAPGRRAITFPVDEVNALAGLLVPGDLVDLLYTERRGSEAVVRPLLQQVLVLATGTTTERPTPGPGPDDASATSFTTVTLSVTPEEAQRVVLAQHAGELTAVLRHPADAASLSSSPLGSNALFGIGGPVRAVRRAAREYVELIVGGARAGGAARTRETLDGESAAARGLRREPPPDSTADWTPAPTPAVGSVQGRAAPRAVDAGSVRARLGLPATPTR